jgi:hypothetical protein
MDVAAVDCASLAEDPAELATVDVEAARLEDDTVASCPVPMQRMLDYLGLETPEGDALTGDDLVFLRTARVGDSEYWFWSFTEPDSGDAAYAWVEVKPRRLRVLGREIDRGRVESVAYETDNYGLSVPQVILALRCGHF